ncbi:MAG: response regulator transcription factor [Candidatus Hydrogenedentota bacterium]
MAAILIVEDDKRTADYLDQHLSDAGHTCVVEPIGEKATETAKENDCDLLILDIMLPGTSGFEVCRRFRRDPDLYMMPIIILTAMKGDEELHHGLAQGADDYIVKPFDINNLIHRMEALLRVSTDRAGNDPVVNLPAAGATKREVQRRVSLREKFAIGYVELLHIREFARQYGDDGRSKAIRHLARAIQQGGRNFAAGSFFSGHMGGGHFVCIVPPQKARSYCELVQKVWGQHLEHFYESVGHHQAYAAAMRGEGSLPLLDVLICLTVCDPKEIAAPHELFDILSQLRAKASVGRQGGIYIDRRGKMG